MSFVLITPTIAKFGRLPGNTAATRAVICLGTMIIHFPSHNQQASLVAVEVFFFQVIFLVNGDRDSKVVLCKYVCTQHQVDIKLQNIAIKQKWPAPGAWYF